MTLFDRVKYLADKRGISLNTLSEELDIGANTLYKWKQSNPKLETLIKVADYFDIDLDYLTGRTNEPDWATTKDLYDLEEMLNNNVNMAFGGDELSEEQKQRIKDILTTLFWKDRNEGK